MRFVIKQNTPLTSCVYRMVLQGDTSAITAPGQFVQVQVPGFYLRRPISVCDWDSETLTLVYKVVGNGTDAMCRMIPGTELDLLTGLGNGFDITRCGERPLLIGGGVGLPPMVGAVPLPHASGQAPDRAGRVQHGGRGVPARGCGEARRAVCAGDDGRVSGHQRDL